jgi:hypothetical protein
VPSTEDLSVGWGLPFSEIFLEGICGVWVSLPLLDS